MPGSLSLQDSEKYVEELLTLFNRFSRLVKEAFHDDSRFLTSRDKVRYCQTPNMSFVQIYLLPWQLLLLPQAYKMVVNDTSVFKLDLPSSRAK